MIAFCANKCDLPKADWVVDSQLAQKFASEANILFYETSAKENINIHNVFHQLAEQLVASNVQREERAGLKIDGPRRKSKCCGNK